MTTEWPLCWDDSFQPVPISRLPEMYKAGYRVWGRYVGPGSAAKHWSAAQIKAWFACGPDTGVAVLAEANGDEPLTSPSLGDDHARSARAAARTLGVPDSVAISPAVDRDVTMAQARGNVAAYMKAWKGADTRPPVPYVEMDAGKYLADAGLSAGTFTPAAYGWDASGKLVTPANAPSHVVMTQEHNGKSMAGGNVDIGHVRSNAPHVWWNPAGAKGSATTGDDDMQLTDIVTVWNGEKISVESLLGKVYTRTGTDMDKPELDQITAANAALTAKVDGLAAALTALAKGGASVDTSAVIAHIDEVAAAQSALVQQQQKQIADLEAKLAAGAQSQADALAAS